MARKTFGSLTPAYQKRLMRGFPDLTRKQLRDRYNRGSLGSRTAARGHARTPERPIRAIKNPERYRDYLGNRTRRGGDVIPMTKRQRVFARMEDMFSFWIGYNRFNVLANVNAMTDSELDWTLNADTEMIRTRASAQVPGDKPWFTDDSTDSQGRTRNRWWYK